MGVPLHHPRSATGEFQNRLIRMHQYTKTLSNLLVDVCNFTTNTSYVT